MAHLWSKGFRVLNVLVLIIGYTLFFRSFFFRLAAMIAPP